MARRRSSIPRIRSGLYASARLLGDVRAVQTGRVPQRATNRLIGHVAGRILGKLWR